MHYRGRRARTLALSLPYENHASLQNKGEGEGGRARLSGVEAEFGGWRKGLENQTADSTEGL